MDMLFIVSGWALFAAYLFFGEQFPKKKYVKGGIIPQTKSETEDALEEENKELHDELTAMLMLESKLKRKHQLINDINKVEERIKNIENGKVIDESEEKMTETKRKTIPTYISTSSAHNKHFKKLYEGEKLKEREKVEEDLEALRYALTRIGTKMKDVKDMDFKDDIFKGILTTEEAVKYRYIVKYKDVNDMVVNQLFDDGKKLMMNHSGYQVLVDDGKKSMMHHSGYRAELLPLGHGMYKLSIIDGVEIKSYSGTISYEDIRAIYLKEKIIDIIECVDLIHAIPIPRHVVSGGF